MVFLTYETKKNSRLFFVKPQKRSKLIAFLISTLWWNKSEKVIGCITLSIRQTGSQAIRAVGRPLNMIGQVRSNSRISSSFAKIWMAVIAPQAPWFRQRYNRE